jgi:hypothetical protein
MQEPHALATARRGRGFAFTEKCRRRMFPNYCSENDAGSICALTTVELGCGLFDIYLGQKNGAGATWSHHSKAWLWFDLSLT